MKDGIISLIISYIVKIFIMSSDFVFQLKTYLYENNSNTSQLDRTFDMIEFGLQLCLFCIIYFIIYLIKYFQNKNN